jgi:hypothetical protein
MTFVKTFLMQFVENFKALSMAASVVFYCGGTDGK